MFDVIASHLMAEVPGSFWTWYDGLASLETRVRKARQVEFTGEIWVGDDSGKQWKEALRATVTDKRVTKQGIWIVLKIGDNRAEGNLAKAFGQIQE